MNKIIIGIMTLMVLTAISFVSATPSPNGPGQPSLSCGSPGAELSPNGFNTAGFAHAGTVYAGSEGSASLLHSNSLKAVSQYDVACFQFTQHH